MDRPIKPKRKPKPQPAPESIERPLESGPIELPEEGNERPPDPWLQPTKRRQGLVGWKVVPLLAKVTVSLAGIALVFLNGLVGHTMARTLGHW